jgi:hypothetical protein
MRRHLSFTTCTSRKGVRPCRASLVMSVAALLVQLVRDVPCCAVPSRDTRPADLVFDPTIAC